MEQTQSLSNVASAPASSGRTISGQALELRTLGRTTLRVSMVGYGASPLGDVFRQTDPAEGVAAVRYAIERGINFFDVSPYYGITVAEERLGAALEGRRDQVVLATKCGRYGEEEFDFSAKTVTEKLEGSLQRLKTDHVDLLQAHDVEFADVEQIIQETIPALRRLQQQGKTKFIGITGYSLKNLMDIASSAAVDSVLSYCRYNLMITDMEQTLTPFARKHGIGVINASALHMGLLTRRGAPSWHPAPVAIKEAGREIVQLCEEHGVDASELALKFCFENPDVASTLVGLSTRAHVDSTLHALSLAVDPELIERIHALLGPLYNTTWPSGRAENYG